jgi:hypothetical protein
LMFCTAAVRVKNCKEIAKMLAALRWMTSVMAWPYRRVELR